MKNVFLIFPYKITTKNIIIYYIFITNKNDLSKIDHLNNYLFELIYLFTCFSKFLNGAGPVDKITS